MPKNEEKKSPAHEEALNAVTNSNFFTQLAEAYRLQGRLDEAIDTCRKGLEKMPDALLGRLILGRCYLEKGLTAEAKEELEKVAAGIEECLSVYKLLSQVYLQEKNVDRALEVLRKALYFPPEEEKPQKGLTPMEMDLFHRKVQPFLAGRKPEAQDELQESQKAAAGEKAQNGFQTDTLAEIYIQQGRKEKALAIFQEILSREPENITVKEKLAALQEQIKKERKIAMRQTVVRQLEHWLAAVSRNDV